jgi:SNF family Na+-dependent transporter
MIGQLMQVLRNEEGIETLEWIAMAAVIIVLVILVAYPGALPNAINAVIGNITTHV